MVKHVGTSRQKDISRTQRCKKAQIGARIKAAKKKKGRYA